MREQYTRFTERGVRLLNLGPDDAQAYRDYWAKHRIPFVGLADPKHVVAKLYHQPVRLLKLGRMPMQLIVDPAGVVRFRYESNGMSDIPDSETVFAKLDELMAAGWVV